MAEHKVSAGTMLLFIDPLGGTKYDTIVCLKSVGITDSINPIDASSWCGKSVLPGIINTSINFDGFLLQDPAVDTLSGTNLRQTLRDKHLISWKIAPENPQPGDEEQTGRGFISDLSSSYRFDSVGDFSGTIQIKGDITNSIIPPVLSTSTFYVSAPNGNTVEIFIERNDSNYLDFYIMWGDGSPNEYYSGGSFFNPIHTYGNDTEVQIEIVFNYETNNYVNYFSYSDSVKGSTTSISIRNLTVLQNLHINNTGISTLDLSYNQLLNYLDLSSNSLLSLNLDYNYYIETLIANDCLINNISINNNPNLLSIELDSNDLSSADVNYILNKLVNYLHYYGIVILTNQITSAPPTGQGITDKTTLQSRFWTVSTD